MEKRNQKGQFAKGSGPSEKARQAASAALKDNQHAVKLTTSELKQEAYQQYCQHIATGRSKESWVFIHPTDPLESLTSKTMDKYIRENPKEFPPIQKEVADAQSYGAWEMEGIMMMKGKVEKCEPAIYQMFMRNKFGWDKETHVINSLEPEVKKLLANWDEMTVGEQK